MEKLCTNKNRSYKHNEQINKQNIDNSECFGVKYGKKIRFWMIIQGFFLHFRILLTDDVCDDGKIYELISKFNYRSQ